MDDEPDVVTHTNRPEVFVFGLFELVQTHPGVRRIELQVERGRLDDFLLITSQPCQAIGKGVGDAEFHSFTSVRWLSAHHLGLAGN